MLCVEEARAVFTDFVRNEIEMHGFEAGVSVNVRGGVGFGV